MAKSGKGSARVSSRHSSVSTTAKSGFTSYKNLHEVRNAHGQATSAWETHLTQAERDGLYQYTTESRSRSYRVTNPPMRREEYADMTTNDIIKDVERNNYVDSSNIKDIKAQHSALSKGVVNEAFIGYRGAGFSLLDAHLNGKRDYASMKALEGETVRDTGAMSISMVKGRQFYGKVLYEVEVPKGKGIGANIMGVGRYGTAEAEFLVNYGTYYHINKVTKYNGSEYDYIVRLTIVGRK